ncbi:hypothetical protein VSU19_19015 [Verrucomicrobiales bacterium BCK34]|nr:hypothetical protein [Verrucomicrobiales bacterium BCK34]
MSDQPPRILYCRCAFAGVVPGDVKDEVLNRLCESGASFETVSDLCEMSARKDPRLKQIFEGDAPIKIAACYPRAVKWLCHNAGITFPEDDSVEVLNMREETAEAIADKLLKNSEES